MASDPGVQIQTSAMRRVRERERSQDARGTRGRENEVRDEKKRSDMFGETCTGYKNVQYFGLWNI